MTGQLLRVLARFVACGDDSCVPLVASDHRSSGRYKLEREINAGKFAMGRNMA